MKIEKANIGRIDRVKICIEEIKRLEEKKAMYGSRVTNGNILLAKIDELKIQHDLLGIDMDEETQLMIEKAEELAGSNSTKNYLTSESFNRDSR